MLAKDSGNAEPPFSVGFVHLIAIIYTLSYVLPFYISPLTRPSPTISRDDPHVIRARIRLVCQSCFICALSTLVLLHYYANVSLLESLRLMGWWHVHDHPMDTIKPILLAAILFVGPLFERGIVDDGWRTWVRGRALKERLNTLMGWRTYVMGPLTEELLFRSFLLPLYLHTSLSSSSIILLLPLPFGLAHIHHAYETRLTRPSAPLAAIIFQSLFQFTYTTLFGWFANFVLVRTGSLMACILCHSGCNWLGLPRVRGRVGEARWEYQENEGSVADEVVLTGGMDGVEKERNDGAAREGNRTPWQSRRPQGRWVKVGDDRGAGWSAAYYALLVGGAMSFWKLLWPLTESGRALAVV